MKIKEIFRKLQDIFTDWRNGVLLRMKFLKLKCSMDLWLNAVLNLKSELNMKHCLHEQFLILNIENDEIWA